MIRSAELSPSGVRAAFEARGEIFSAGGEGRLPQPYSEPRRARPQPRVVARRRATRVALGRERGEYQLMIGEPTGVTKPRAIPLPSTAYFSAPAWSPDGSQILLQDNHLISGRSMSRPGRRR